MKKKVALLIKLILLQDNQTYTMNIKMIMAIIKNKILMKTKKDKKYKKKLIIYIKEKGFKLTICFQSKLKSNQKYQHPILNIIINPTPIIFVDLPLGAKHIQTAKFIDFFIHIDIPLDIGLSRQIIKICKRKNYEELLNYLIKYPDIRELFKMDDVKNSSDLVLDGRLRIDALVSKILRQINLKY